MKINRYNIGLYQITDPPWNSSSSDRKIKTSRDEPLYAASVVLPLLNTKAIRTWPGKAVRNAADLNLDLSELAALLTETVNRGRYIDSEWCEQAQNGPFAACDSYTLERSEWNSVLKKEMPCRYFFKFAVAKHGNLIMIASCHLSG